MLTYLLAVVDVPGFDPIDMIPRGDWAGVAQIIMALSVMVTSIAGLVIGIRNSRQTNVIHEVVNSNFSAQTDRIEQLTQALAPNMPPMPPNHVLVPDKNGNTEE